MRVIPISLLQEDMILGEDLITTDNNIIFRKYKTLTKLDLQVLKNYALPSKVWILDLLEIKPLVVCSSTEFSRGYINNMINSFRQIFNVALVDLSNFNKICDLSKLYFERNRRVLYETIVLKDKHHYTYEHSINVTMYALLMGLSLGLTDRELFDIIIGGIFHDIGKLCISNTILDKPSALNDSELKAIKQHPLYSLELSDSFSFINDRSRNIVIQHHEKLDGSGYPYNLKKNQISDLAQIVTIADMFDAIVSKRSYHEMRSNLDGISILKNDVSRGKLNKEFTEALVKQLVLFKQNDMLILSNGLYGWVMEDTCNLRPRIMLQSEKVYDLSLHKDVDIVSVT